jgi:O-antigen/teichoic acid export membrane protein
MISKILHNKALILSVTTIAITVILQLIFIRFASYTIDREDYGNFILIQTLLTGLFLLFLQMPIQAFDRFFNEVTDKTYIVNEFRTLVFILGIVSFVIIGIYGMIMKKFSFELLFLIYILFLLIANFTIEQRILLISFNRKKYLYAKTLDALSKFIFPVATYFYFQSLISLFVGMVIGYSISIIIMYIYMLEHKIKFLLIRNNAKRYFIYSYPIFFFALFNWGITFSDRYFIEYYLTTSDVGIYGILGMVAGIGQIVGQVFSIYVEPKILKLHSKNTSKAHKVLNRYILLLSSIFVLITIVALVLPIKVYTLLISSSIISDKYYFNTMIILLVTVFIGVIHTAYHMHLKLIKRLNMLAYIYFIAFCVNFFGNFYIKQYGIIIAGISTLASYLIILVLQIIYIFLEKNKSEKDLC